MLLDYQTDFLGNIMLHHVGLRHTHVYFTNNTNLFKLIDHKSLSMQKYLLQGVCGDTSPWTYESIIPHGEYELIKYLGSTSSYLVRRVWVDTTS
jgi:hypothetical protein